MPAPMTITRKRATSRVMQPNHDSVWIETAKGARTFIRFGRALSAGP